ncbi:hypothetical protein HDU97_004563 [Phlyctochytrium planicorne]|nr:hypothetical protein HDU97_004563 [Phlyctochytrium planicorne]
MDHYINPYPTIPYRSISKSSSLHVEDGWDDDVEDRHGDQELIPHPDHHKPRPRRHSETAAIASPESLTVPPPRLAETKVESNATNAGTALPKKLVVPGGSGSSKEESATGSKVSTASSKGSSIQFSNASSDHDSINGRSTVSMAVGTGSNGSIEHTPRRLSKKAAFKDQLQTTLPANEKNPVQPNGRGSAVSILKRRSNSVGSPKGSPATSNNSLSRLTGPPKAPLLRSILKAENSGSGSRIGMSYSSGNLPTIASLSTPDESLDLVADGDVKKLESMNSVSKKTDVKNATSEAKTEGSGTLVDVVNTVDAKEGIEIACEPVTKPWQPFVTFLMPGSTFHTLFLAPIELDQSSKVFQRFWKVWKPLIVIIHIISLIFTPLELGWPAAEYWIKDSLATTSEETYGQRWEESAVSENVYNSTGAINKLGRSHYKGFSIFLTMHLIIDFAILIDLYLDLRQATVDECGSTVTDSKALIYRTLIKRGGWLKVLAALPWELAVMSREISLEVLDPADYSSRMFATVLFIKLIFRTPFLYLFNSDIPFVRRYKALHRLLKSVLLLILIAHMDTCVFWALTTSLPADPPTRWADTNYLLIDPETDAVVPFSTQYLEGFLTALRAIYLRSRHVSTKEPLETTYAILEMVLGVLTSGTVVGMIHSVVELLDRNSVGNHAAEEHRHARKTLSNYMKESGLSPPIQDMVLAYHELNFQKTKGIDESFVFQDLPKSLLQRIKNHLFRDLLKNVQLFADMDDEFLDLVALKMRSLDVLDNWQIFRKNDQGEEIYIIKKGHVQILDGEGKILTTLGPGACFGEIALYEECRRTATAKAFGGPCELVLLKKDDFRSILRTNLEFSRRIRQAVQARYHQSAPPKVRSTSSSYAVLPHTIPPATPSRPRSIVED